MQISEEIFDIFTNQPNYKARAIQSKIDNNEKPLGMPTFNFQLSLSPYFFCVYNKYKILYPPARKKLKDSLNRDGILSSLLNNASIPLFQFSPEKPIPLDGLIIPDSTEFDKTIPKINDISLLLSFVNITNHKGIMNWVEKYGAIKNYSYEYEILHSQPIEDFISELYILKSLYQLLSAANEYACSNKTPLTNRVKIIKLADYVKNLDTYDDSSPSKYFWGYNYIVPIEKNKENTEKLKKKPGYILLIDNMPTPSYFETITITNETLPIKVMEVITGVINNKINNHYRIDSHAIQPNTDKDNALAMFRVIPTVQCDNILTLMYFQLLWLISSDGQRKCQKCNQYFLPDSKRPGRQKYCGKCGKHAAQDQYKKRTLAAIKAYKMGISLEQAASENKITIKRLTKALEAGV